MCPDAGDGGAKDCDRPMRSFHKPATKRVLDISGTPYTFTELPHSPKASSTEWNAGLEIYFYLHRYHLRTIRGGEKDEICERSLADGQDMSCMTDWMAKQGAGVDGEEFDWSRAGL